MLRGSYQRRTVGKASRTLIALGLLAVFLPAVARAQQRTGGPPPAEWKDAEVRPAAGAFVPRGPVSPLPTLSPSPQSEAKAKNLIAETLEAELTMELDLHRSKLIRTTAPITRFSVTRPEVLDVVQYTPTEFELLGLGAGETTLTIWFGDHTTLRYLVTVLPDTFREEQSAVEYGNLQRKINEMFPNSVVQLIPLADKLIVRGQAKDAEEAAQILSVLSSQVVNQVGGLLGPGTFGYGYGGLMNWGAAARSRPGAADLPASNLINLLDVPGEQQVMLKVRVAELSRTALRQMGVELQVHAGDFSLQSLLGATQVFSAVLNTDDVKLALQALSTNSYSRILAEPNLVTLNGQPASFLAGGEFAVPTVVGVQGVSAVSNQFRGFGTQLTFTPTIVDKDRVRLTVAPSFSSLNRQNTVEGIPGLDTRAVITTVDLREGQWLAIAGLLQDEQTGGNTRVPLIGDIPVLGALFSHRTVRRGETELVILVSPELIHPMDAQETPLILPGMEVSEPGDLAFFLRGAYEGNAYCAHRSTVWPTYQQRVLEAKCQAASETKCRTDYQSSEKYYVYGPHGLSR